MHISGDNFNEISKHFQWEIPGQFNMGVACCDVHAEATPEKTALLEWRPDNKPTNYSFQDLKTASNKLANALNKLGFAQGDRLGIILPQSFETALCHIAVYKSAGIAVPIARLFAADALAYRLKRAGVSIIVTNRYGADKLAETTLPLPDLKHIICIDEKVPENTISFHDICDEASSDFTPVDTTPDTPALIIFTSGTTGPPKGALHGHRVLIGHLPGVQMHHEFMPQENDRAWTPADWAWAGGLLNILMPSLCFGVPVIFGGLDRFDPEKAFQLMSEMKVANAFIPPTALRLMKTVETPAKRFDLSIRTIGSGGESLGEDTFDWAQRELGIQINEFYGQTECNLVLSSCAKLGVLKRGAIGKPVPGHTVAIVDDNGVVCPPGTQGQVAIMRPDPVMFLGYWQDTEATEKKYINDWMVTGDQAIMDEDGYFHFVGRDDDIINYAGYRVGPGEIEDCLISHPAVKLAVAVGKPDPLRSEIIKAFVVLQDDIAQSNALAEEIKAHVKSRMAANIYPREVEFIEEIPMTTTGKVIRRLFREQAKKEAEESTTS
ncbi:MAG: AMP-dependent synthetase [Hyphomicrobiales bacterium]|nr:MAG: AMP-dependent synthetase [Hyphomicrobiales bacterium]